MPTGSVRIKGVTYDHAAYWESGEGVLVALVRGPIDCSRETRMNWRDDRSPPTVALLVRLPDRGMDEALTAFRGTPFAVDGTAVEGVGSFNLGSSFNPISAVVRLSRTPSPRVSVTSSSGEGTLSLERCSGEEPELPALAASVPDHPVAGTINAQPFEFPYALARISAWGVVDSLELYAERPPGCEASFFGADAPTIGLDYLENLSKPELLHAPQPVIATLSESHKRNKSFGEARLNRDRILGYVSFEHVEVEPGGEVKALVRLGTAPGASSTVELAGTVSARVCR